MHRKSTCVSAVAATLLSVALASTVLSSAVASAQAPLPDHEVKAAFLYHFTQFIEWPLPDDNSPFLICVAKHSASGAALERILNGKALGSHPLKVSKISHPFEAQPCRMLFLPSVGKQQLQEYLQVVAESGVLTVGDHPDFRELGGMIELFLEDQHIAFRMNVQAMQRAHLIASSRLLRLARQAEPSMPAEGYQ